VAARCGWDMGQLVFQALHRWASQGGEVDGLSSIALRQVAEESQRHGLTPQEYLRVLDFGPHN
jgi:phage-related minor tail protein